jgi:hypothetical protein
LFIYSLNIYFAFLYLNLLESLIQICLYNLQYKLSFIPDCNINLEQFWQGECV